MLPFRLKKAYIMISETAIA